MKTIITTVLLVIGLVYSVVFLFFFDIKQIDFLSTGVEISVNKNDDEKPILPKKKAVKIEEVYGLKNIKPIYQSELRVTSNVHGDKKILFKKNITISLKNGTILGLVSSEDNKIIIEKEQDRFVLKNTSLTDYPKFELLALTNKEKPEFEFQYQIEGSPKRLFTTETYKYKDSVRLNFGFFEKIILLIILWVIGVTPWAFKDVKIQIHGLKSDVKNGKLPHHNGKSANKTIEYIQEKFELLDDEKLQEKLSDADEMDLAPDHKIRMIDRKLKSFVRTQKPHTTILAMGLLTGILGVLMYFQLFVWPNGLIEWALKLVVEKVLGVIVL